MNRWLKPFAGLILCSALSLTEGCGDWLQPGQGWRDPSVLSVEDVFVRPLPKAPVLNFEQHSPRIDSFFRELQQDKKFNGTVLYAEGDKVIHEGAYGYADMELRDSLQVNSVFQLASVTKIFTATAILLLWEDGRLHPDDDVSRYLPDFPYPGLTIRHLLNHRSGLADYSSVVDYENCETTLIRPLDVLDYFMKKKPPLQFSPATGYDYNNANYVLLSVVVTYAACMPYEQFLKERVFAPLGMKDTYFVTHTERVLQPRHTIGYRPAGRKFEIAGGDCFDGIIGDKGLHSTVQDLFRFDRALNQQELLSSGTQRVSFLPGSFDQSGANYGFGWRMRDDYPGIVYHFGWWRGYRSCFIRDIFEDRTLIILSNIDQPDLPETFWSVYNFATGWKENN
ncbi:MAG: class A beta-lactamase-related serine hydrolase [Bacteroidetes bacterium]|nr:MAG: class A beta-lactamase-related serine hydrolase [Bacteroidota bacterium]